MRLRPEKKRNFRVVENNEVEVDFTVRLSAETVMHRLFDVVKEMQQIDAVINVTVDDLPTKIIEQFVKDTLRKGGLPDADVKAPR